MDNIKLKQEDRNVNKYKDHIVSPEYSCSKLEEIYYGTEENMNISNPTAKFITAVSLTLVLLWFLYLFVLIKTKAIVIYAEWLINTAKLAYLKIKQISNIDMHEMDIFIIFILGTIAVYVFLLPIIIIPRKFFLWIIHTMKSYFVKTGKLYKSPLNFLEYKKFKKLYEEAERAEKYLISGNVCDIEIADKDTVCLCVREQLISKKIRLQFENMAFNIFKKNRIDFPEIDRELDKLLKKAK